MSDGAVTVINTTSYNWQPVPEVGKEYHAFDDGKIKPSRHSIVRITEIVPFTAVNNKVFQKSDSKKQKIVIGFMPKKQTTLLRQTGMMRLPILYELLTAAGSHLVGLELDLISMVVFMKK